MVLWLRGHVQIFFVMYVLWLLVVPVGCKGGVTGKVTGRATCKSTGPGEPARVTCHYGLNVVETRDVSAVFLLRENDGKQEKVVECHRFLNNGFDCLPTVGYKLHGTLSDQMIINIYSTLPVHEGTYYCEIGIQQTDIQMGSCVLEYQVPNDSTSAPPSEHDSDDHLEGDAGGASMWMITTAVVLSVMLIVIVVLSALLFIVRRRRRRDRGQPEAHLEKHDDTTTNLLQPAQRDSGIQVSMNSVSSQITCGSEDLNENGLSEAALQNSQQDSITIRPPIQNHRADRSAERVIFVDTSFLQDFLHALTNSRQSQENCKTHDPEETDSDTAEYNSTYL